MWCQIWYSPKSKNGMGRKRRSALLVSLKVTNFFCGQLLIYLVLQIGGKILKTSSGNMWSNIEYPQNKEWNGQKWEERSFCFH